MTFGSCFAGIGGMDLGLERAGLKCRWQIEVDCFCTKVLEKHWPTVRRYGDIKTVEGQQLERVDVIAGGFPCQDISLQGAVWGERKGIDGDRSGLWWEMLRIARVVRPRYILVENVAAILGNGMGAVLGSLSESGFDAEWDCIPGAALGTPHERDRMFLVAYNREERRQGRWSKTISRIEAFPWFQNVRSVEDVRARPDLPEPLIRIAGHGVSAKLAGLGNAVVPQVAQWIGERLIEFDSRAVEGIS